MAKIVLVHGFGAGVEYSIFQKAEGNNAGFLVFEELLQKNSASVFDWRIKKKLSWWQILLFYPILQIYWQEKQRAKNPQTQDELAQFLQKGQPEIIICHSMGASLLFEHTQILPKSVKKIVLVQADISNNLKIPQNFANIEILNYFCPWDQALLFSNLLNLKIMAGQVGLKNVTNIFFPLIANNPNLHTFPLRSQRFLGQMQTFLKNNS